MDNTKQIRRAGNTYFTRHQPPAVQRTTQRERPALFTFSGNGPPKRKRFWTREAVLDAIVIGICVAAIVAIAFGLGWT